MPVLKVEHFACNVSDPVAAWYAEPFGMRVLRRMGESTARGMFSRFSIAHTE